ncbi:MAG: hypothetical protein KGQ41_07405 [Alphaproteobacteria bacterium]|nr:hypothetical protein [Alphaproteobacteria bacterium]
MEARHPTPPVRSLRMTGASLTSSGALNGLPMQVRYSTLLLFMGFAPFALCLVLLDQLFLDGLLQDVMHIGTEHMINLMAILTFPHIVASLISFADREYISYYRTPLIKMLVVSFGLAIASKVILGGNFIMIVVAFYSLYHNIMQQFGIASMMLGKKPDTRYKAIKWLLVVPSCLGYAVVTFPFFPGMGEYHEVYMHIVGLCIGIATVMAAQYYARIHNDKTIPAIGKIYFMSNVLWMLVTYAMILADYANLAILVSRVVHDFTAYWIYTVHDTNRNTGKIHNRIYAAAAKIGLRPRHILLPLSLLVSGSLLLLEGKGDFIAILIGAVNMMHYYIEGHMWKRGTPHRQYVPFV